MTIAAKIRRVSIVRLGRLAIQPLPVEEERLTVRLVLLVPMLTLQRRASNAKRDGTTMLPRARAQPATQDSPAARALLSVPRVAAERTRALPRRRVSNALMVPMIMMVVPTRLARTAQLARWIAMVTRLLHARAAVLEQLQRKGRQFVNSARLESTLAPRLQLAKTAAAPRQTLTIKRARNASLVLLAKCRQRGGLDHA